MNILSYDSKHVTENITEYKGQKQYKQYALQACTALPSSILDNEFGVIKCILQQYRDGIIPMRTKVVKQWLVACEKWTLA